MAYLRWGFSNWYAYWSCVSGETKEDQILEVWYAGNLKPIFLYYSVLKEVKTIEDLKEIVKNQVNINVSDKDYEELLYEELLEEAIKPFVKDVEEEFKNEEICIHKRST